LTRKVYIRITMDNIIFKTYYIFIMAFVMRAAPALLRQRAAPQLNLYRVQTFKVNDE
jgi:hypothetical protein